MKRIFQIAALGLALTTFVGIAAYVAGQASEQPRTTSEVSDLSLRETIREVAAATNVLPLDVYSGTTLSEYRGWDCRYDLTYKEFRPNYVLCATARGASVQEVLECVDDLSRMNSKEQALTCAALIAFVAAGRERETRGVSRLSSNGETETSSVFSDDEKRIVLQKLKKELGGRKVAFRKIEGNDAELSAQWEENIRKECFSFMKLPERAYLKEPDPSGYRYHYSEITTRDSCFDLYEYPSPTSERRSDSYYLFDEWRDGSKQLSVKFLCALVLAQAAYDASQLRSFDDSNEQALRSGAGFSERALISERFLRGRSEIVKEDGFVPDRAFNERRAIGEGLIMNAYLRTQYVASRLGRGGSKAPICGNSSKRDITTSEVVQKAIDVMTLGASPASNFERQAESLSASGEEERSRTTTLEAIRKYANASQVFSARLFIDLYECVDCELRDRSKMRDRLRLWITYDSLRPLSAIYEAASRATRAEIVDCLNSFDELSVIEKAFVLESATFYLWRSENPKALEKQSQGERAEPLSDDEKRLLARLVLDCKNSQDPLIFGVGSVETKTSGSGRFDLPDYYEKRKELIESWEKSFRKSALEFQKAIGKRNPFYFYSSDTAEEWRRFCDEAPIVLLYSALSMETLLDLEELKLVPTIDDSAVKEDARRDEFGEGAEDDRVRSEIDLMKRYLYIQSNLRMRRPYWDAALSGMGPGVEIEWVSRDADLDSVARGILNLFPQISTGGIPQFTRREP